MFAQVWHGLRVEEWTYGGLGIFCARMCNFPLHYSACVLKRNGVEEFALCSALVSSSLAVKFSINRNWRHRNMKSVEPFIPSFRPTWCFDVKWLRGGAPFLQPASPGTRSLQPLLHHVEPGAGTKQVGGVGPSRFTLQTSQELVCFFIAKPYIFVFYYNNGRLHVCITVTHGFVRLRWRPKHIFWFENL